MKWHKIESLSDLETIKANSHQQKVFIFKHSTRCNISAMVLDRLERNWKAEANTQAWFLDLIAFREVSNAIANDFAVEHQSPQVLLIENGVCTFNASHGAISAAALV